MTPWILVAVAGGVLFMVGVAVLVAKYFRGDIDGTELLVTIAGYGSVAAIALASVVKEWHFGGEWLLILVIVLVEIWRWRHRRRVRARSNPSGR